MENLIGRPTVSLLDRMKWDRKKEHVTMYVAIIDLECRIVSESCGQRTELLGSLIAEILLTNWLTSLIKEFCSKDSDVVQIPKQYF